MKGIIKRITCLLCALIIATTALLSCPLKVKATSIPAPVGSEATIEALMTIWNLLVNGMIASGAGEAVADYDSEKSLMDAFMDFCSSMVATNSEYAESFVARTTGGQYVSLDDMVVAYDKGTITMPDWWVDEWDVDEETGEDVITFPNEQSWGKYRVLVPEDWEQILLEYEKLYGSEWYQSQEPQAPKDPEFSKLETFSINAGFLTMLSDFFTSVFNDEVEDVVTEDYFPVENTNGSVIFDYGCNYEVRYDEDGNPLYNLKIVNTANKTFEVIDYSNGGYLAGVLNSSTKRLIIYGTASHESSTQWAPCGGTAYYSTTRFPYYEVNEVYTDIPLFTNSDAKNQYLSDMEKNISPDISECINKKQYDYSELIMASRNVLAPLTGVQLSPSTLQKTYTGMKTNYEEDVKTQTFTDVATNTQTYTETMKQTITDTVTSVSPSPAPSPDIPGTDIGTETEAEIDDYKVDLRMVFPFCLPFDFIALLQALDTEPETPKFEIPFVVPALDLEMTVDIDLSFLDDVMVNLRRIELVGFIVFLIFATGKLIKW